MLKPRFALYNTRQDNILCKKQWSNSNGNSYYNFLWTKVEESRYLILSSSGVDVLIDHICYTVLDELVPVDQRSIAHNVAQFLVLNSFDKDLIIIPIKQVGASYTDEWIEQGLDFVNGFGI